MNFVILIYLFKSSIYLISSLIKKIYIYLNELENELKKIAFTYRDSRVNNYIYDVLFNNTWLLNLKTGTKYYTTIYLI